MHGAGNDFCLFNGFEQQFPDLSKLAVAVCDRHFGVGGDGIMVCYPSAVADIRMVYYNSDGSQGEMCGNGIRCFAKYVYQKGLITKPIFSVETLAGIKEIELCLEQSTVAKVSVGMGTPFFETEAIPTMLPGMPVKLVPLEVLGQTFCLTAMRMGVPHSVIFVDDLESCDVNLIGRAIETHPAFPEKTNVNFVQILAPDSILVKTWERGAGRTLACGTGCCSCVVAGHLLGYTLSKVQVQAEGGVLMIEVFPEEDYRVQMTGPAEVICDGTFSDWVVARI